LAAPPSAWEWLQIFEFGYAPKIQMGRLHPDRRVFRRGDNVLGYWVDHAEGFEVRAGAQFRGRVDAVVVDPQLGRAKQLVVRSVPFGRRHVIPADTVVAVDPFNRWLEVERARYRWITGAASSLTPLVVALVAGIARLLAWSAPRLGHATVAGFGGARRCAHQAAAALAWLAPRLRTAATRASVLALRFARGLATLATSIVAWLAPRLGQGARSARTHTASLARSAGTILAAAGWLCLFGLLAAGAWIAPRLRASAKAVAWATVTCAVAAADVVGTQLSHRARYVSPPRRN
jgi:hypothetical protein